MAGKQADGMSGVQFENYQRRIPIYREAGPLDGYLIKIIL